ncbi:MAG: SpoIVB peptidase S55 domain-containing protein [Acidobacteriota bacterium]
MRLIPFAAELATSKSRPSATSAALLTLFGLLLSIPAVADDVSGSADPATLGVPEMPDSIGLDRELAALLPGVDVGQLPLETLAPHLLERGQKGYGISVFAGQERERFDVEVIGLWQGASPEITHILTRLSGKGLERSGVMQGMSGSPVFIDGKLIGAVAFSFSFGLDPIAGITPIDSMRALATAAGGLGIGSTERENRVANGPGNPTLARVAQGAQRRLPRDLVPSFDDLRSAAVGSIEPAGQGLESVPHLLERHLGLLVGPQGPEGARSALSWTAGGFAGASRELLGARLGALAPLAGGGMSAGGSKSGELADASDLGPGDAVALVLVQGDLSLAAHGTITDRVGDSIVAFGHPVYSLGPIRLPMARSDVITTIPSRSSSFKLSNAGPLIGVFDQDREPGAHGVIGAQPGLVPMRVELRGLSERNYELELADSSMFKPTLTAVGVLGALNSGSYSTGFLGLDLEARLSLDGYDDLVLAQSFDGSQSSMNAVVYLLTIAAFLELNEENPTPITGMEVNLHQYAKPRLTKLLGARAPKTRVVPGEKVPVWIDLQPQRGERTRVQIDVEIPDNAPLGRYWAMIGDGTSMDAARLLIEKRTPENFEQQLEAMRAFHSRKQLHVIGLTASNGRSHAGDVLPDLPPSMRAVYAGEGESLQLRIVDDQETAWQDPLEGIFRVDFVVEAPAG